MPTAISRTQFLRGQFAGKAGSVRPPWAVAEVEFVEHCNRCGDCLGACPEKIIEKGSGGFPVINFSKGGCLFCGECAQVCHAQVFSDVSTPPWLLNAEIDKTCLAMRGVECRSCKDHCEIGAIRFRLRVGGAALPILDTLNCTGCGACISVCPESAIELTTHSAQEG